MKFIDIVNQSVANSSSFKRVGSSQEYIAISDKDGVISIHNMSASHLTLCLSDLDFQSEDWVMLDITGEMIGAL